MKELKEIQPSAARLIESLRDTGYTFTTAIADIVDNSVAAGATNIKIRLEIEVDGSPVLMIADNGCGMSYEELENAMVYGSPKRSNPDSLGKFGMGLKTASSSFCRKLTVISRKNNALNIKQWDLDRVAETNKWVILEPEADEYEEQISFLNSVTGGENGSLVIWENIDRLVRTNMEGTARVQVEKIVQELEEHLSGVFYNFLEKSESFPDLEIHINDKKVEPWDPFCRWLNTEEVKRVEVHPNPSAFKKELNGVEETIGEFHVNVYILPVKGDLTPEELQKARYGLDNQGFHVFREGRMIFSGGWPNRLFVKEPHMNLVRIELLFDHRLDDYFQIDIKKSRIDLPKDLRAELKKLIAPARHEANRRYRKGNKGIKSTQTSALGQQHVKSSNSINRHHQENTQKSVIDSYDKENGEAEIRNAYGKTRVKLQLDDSHDRLVQPVENLQDSVLWRPGLVDGNKHAVFINESHEFYKRFYHGNMENSNIVLAMDSMLWSLAEAELSVLSDKVKRNLEDMRINVSRSLRTLAEELPDTEEFEKDKEE